MDIDHALTQAMAQYSQLRRRINRAIRQDIIGVPMHGAADALQWIDRLEQPNVTLLSEALGITRGGASKAVSKLQSQGLVERYQLPDNRKEVYYRLTPTGVTRLEQLRHSLEVLTEQELQFIRTLTQEQKQIALDFLSGYVASLTAANPALFMKEGDACVRP